MGRADSGMAIQCKFCGYWFDPQEEGRDDVCDDCLDAFGMPMPKAINQEDDETS